MGPYCEKFFQNYSISWNCLGGTPLGKINSDIFFRGRKNQVKEKHAVCAGPVPSCGTFSLKKKLSTLPVTIAAVSWSTQSSWIFKMSVSPKNQEPISLWYNSRSNNSTQTIFKGGSPAWFRSSINNVIAWMAPCCAKEFLGYKNLETFNPLKAVPFTFENNLVWIEILTCPWISFRVKREHDLKAVCYELKPSLILWFLLGLKRGKTWK